MRLAILTAALVALLPASAQAADLVVDGHGWGHGVGMSQYGAYGYALREGRDARFILAHYYTGSSYGTAPAARMRVRLKRNRVQRISGATLARAANGRRVKLAETRIYRFQQTSTNKIQIVNTSNGNTRARLVAPVTVTGGANTTRARHGRQRPAQRRLPRPDRALARRALDPRGQQRRPRAVPVRRGRGRDAGELARRGAQGPGRRRALVRPARPPAGRALRRVRRRPLAGLPRRAGRDRLRPTPP